jgi:membrane fusion protein
MKGLFRKEALKQHTSPRFGSGLALPPLSFKVFTVFVCLIVVAVGSLLYWGNYADKKTVVGYILPSSGVINVRAPQRGTIVSSYVQLGDHVHKGQKLYRLKLLRSTLNTTNVNSALLNHYDDRLKSVRAQIKIAKRLKAAKIAQLERQQSDLKAERKQLDDQLHTANAISALVQDNLSRYKRLAKKGMVSKSGLQEVQRKVLTQKATVQQIEKTRLELRTRLDQIPAEISQVKADTARKVAELKSQVAQIEQQRLQLQVAQGVVVRAPDDGVISSLIARVGQNVSTQSTLLSILPRGSILQARLLVPTSAIGFVHAGQSVRLRYSAFPYQQFGLYHGKLRKVSRSIVVPGELHLPVSLEGPYYLVTASLAKPYVCAYGKKLPLTAGMTLSADIVLNREPLYEWVLRPIESLRGRL